MTTVQINLPDKLAQNAQQAGDTRRAMSNRAPQEELTPKLQQQIERIGQLPKTKQRFVMEMLDTVLAQAGQ